jgi:hypothetical protein
VNTEALFPSYKQSLRQTMGNALAKVNLDELTEAELLEIKAKVDEAFKKVKSLQITDKVLKVGKNGDDRIIVKSDSISALPTPPKRENKSVAANPEFRQEKKGVSKIFAGLTGSSDVNIEKKILLSNKSGYKLIFIVSSDPHAQQFGSGKLGISTGGVEAGLNLGSRSIINQQFQLQDKGESEVMVRTAHAYVTICRKKSTGDYAVYRYRREVPLGSTYTATEEMLSGNDDDVRPSTFLQEFP